MAFAMFSTSTFQGLRPLNKLTDSSTTLALTKPNYYKPITTTKRASGVKAELNASLVISLSTGLSLFLGWFVFFNFQRENVAKQGLPEHNGITHFKAGGSRAKEYVSLLKLNDPFGFILWMCLLGDPLGMLWLTISLLPQATTMISASLADFRSDPSNLLA